MNLANNYLLAVNGGSSSIKLGVFENTNSPSRVLSASIERIGLSDSRLKITDHLTNIQETLSVKAPDHKTATQYLIELINKHHFTDTVEALGHRIVCGGQEYIKHEPITANLIAKLRQMSPFDPEHLPAELAIIDIFKEKFPNALQMACFDTVFHQQIPRIAKIIPIPRRFEKKGIQRFGFHGLSYTFLMTEFEKLVGSKTAQGKIILCHLGNGASLAAVDKGQCIDTTMGFSPTSGLVMSTRSGDLDPELIWFLTQTEGMTASEFHNMVNHESGLLGVSETSSDIRDLLKLENSDTRAAEAVALFCYQIKKWIGAFSAALGGVDSLIFSGGIGENSPEIRKRVCDGLKYLGIELIEARNLSNEGLISIETAPVTVRIIHTDEELMIAKATQQHLKDLQYQGKPYERTFIF